jgi:diguanylate cyclase (GGDEF)-like protein
MTDGPGLEVLLDVLRHALDGIAVVQADAADSRVIYVNATLAGMLQRTEDSLVGHALDELERPPEGPGPAEVSPRVHLRCSDGTYLECERWDAPLGGDRRALYYRPATRAAGENGQSALMVAADRAVGLKSREHLIEVLRRDWSIGQRDGRSITVMRFTIDDFKSYHEVFGRVAAESVQRQIGRTLASAMRRASDVVTRMGASDFLALGVSMDPEAAQAYAESILGRIRLLALHHPRSTTGRFMTVSVGVVTAVPPRERHYESILDAADEALKRAQRDGGNRVAAGSIA